MAETFDEATSFNLAQKTKNIPDKGGICIPKTFHNEFKENC